MKRSDTIFAICSGIIVAILAPSLYFSSKTDEITISTIIQAGGSIWAIFVAIWVNSRQVEESKIEAKNQKSDENFRALVLLQSIAKDLVSTLEDLQTETKKPSLTFVQISDFRPKRLSNLFDQMIDLPMSKHTLELYLQLQSTAVQTAHWLDQFNNLAAITKRDLIAHNYIPTFTKTAKEKLAAIELQINQTP